jgi:hypothetical protein
MIYITANSKGSFDGEMLPYIMIERKRYFENEVVNVGSGVRVTTLGIYVKDRSKMLLFFVA